MRVRVGFVRGAVGVIGLALLVLPVGVVTPEGPRPVGLVGSLAELARGRLGIGLLGALVAGGSLTRAGFLRLGLAAGAWVVFALLGPVGRRAPGPPPRERQRTCPACGFVTARRMGVCPACGHHLA